MHEMKQQLHQMTVDTKRVIITDFDETTVRSFLSCRAEPSIIVQEIQLNVEQLLSIATKYQMTPLVTFAEHYIASQITVDNILQTLLFGEQNDNVAIKVASIIFICDHADVILADAAFPSTLGVKLCAELFQYMATKRKLVPK